MGAGTGGPGCHGVGGDADRGGVGGGGRGPGNPPLAVVDNLAKPETGP